MGNQTRPAAQASIIPTHSSTDRHRACSFRTGSGSVFSTSLWWCLGLISWYSRGLRGVHAEPQNLRVKLRPAAEAPWFVVAVTQLCAVPAFLRGFRLVPTFTLLLAVGGPYGNIREPVGWGGSISWKYSAWSNPLS